MPNSIANNSEYVVGVICRYNLALPKPSPAPNSPPLAMAISPCTIIAAAVVCCPRVLPYLNAISHG